MQVRSILIGAVVLALITTAAHGQTQTFGDGTHVIGLDIQPGIYRAPGGERCVWQRLSGLGGTVKEIIAMDAYPKGRPTVEILAEDMAFSSEGCGEWTPLGTPRQPTAAQDADNMEGSTAVVVTLTRFMKLLTVNADEAVVSQMHQLIREITRETLDSMDASPAQRRVAAELLRIFESTWNASDSG